MRTQFLFTSTPPVGRLCVVGDLDLSTRDRLREVLETLRRDGCFRVEVDLAEVTFVDACSLAVLDAERRHVTAGGGTFDVVAASRKYQRAVRLAGYDELSAPTRLAPRTETPDPTSPTTTVLEARDAPAARSFLDQGPDLVT